MLFKVYSVLPGLQVEGKPFMLMCRYTCSPPYLLHYGFFLPEQYCAIAILVLALVLDNRCGGLSQIHLHLLRMNTLPHIWFACGFLKSLCYLLPLLWAQGGGHGSSTLSLPVFLPTAGQLLIVGATTTIYCAIVA